MTGTADLRAGLIGLGMMGRHHARVLRTIDGVELVAVADPMGDPHSVSGELAVHDSVTDLISAGIDYCVVAVPTAFHHAIAMELARHGIHALIEKPLAANSAEASDIVEAFAAAGLVGGVGHIERYNPALQQPVGGRRPGRSVPGRDPPGRPVPCTHRRRGRGQGPGHP